MLNKIIITILFCAFSLCGLSQKKDDNRNKSRYRPGLLWFHTGWKNGQAPKYDRLMFDITYNDWIGERKTFAMKGPSMGMNVSWMFDIPLNKRSTISIGVGPSYGFYNLRHDLPVYLDNTESFTQFGEIAGIFGKRKLVGHQLSLPLEFRFRTPDLIHFKVHLGGKIAYQLALFEKGQHTLNGTEVKFKNPSFKDVNRFVYSVHVRVGIRNFALYASYNFNPLFNHDLSTKMHLLQLGLSISLF